MEKNTDITRLNTEASPSKALTAETIESVLLKGDLSKLNDEQRLSYYQKVCASVGLNPLTRPFEYITLNGRLILYATKSCTDQLRQVHKISIEIASREKVGEVYVVTARAKDPVGRVDESTGAVALGKAFGDSLANLYMKAETKAKRRVTLSICGLAVLDETEVETIPNAARPKLEMIPPAPMPFDNSIKEIEAEVQTEQPVDQDPGKYVIKFGKYKDKTLESLAVSLFGYKRWCEENIKAPNLLVKEFYEAVEIYGEHLKKWNKRDQQDGAPTDDGLGDIPF